MTTSNEPAYLPLTTTDIDISSRTDVLHPHTKIVSEYLKDLPYDDIPIEIVALISKFYASHTNKSIDSRVRQVLPETCTYTNTIPTNRSQSSFCSTKSLLSIPQFAIEITFLALVFGQIIFIYYLSWHPGLLGIHAISGIIYIYNLYLFLSDSHRVISIPLKDVNDRVFGLNYIFGTTPVIKLTMKGRRHSGKEWICTFQKEGHLKLHQCDTIIKPNIYDTKYGCLLYHFEFDALLHFDHERDRLKYLEIVIKFILTNIHDSHQDFYTSVRNVHINDIQWNEGNKEGMPMVDCGDISDNHCFLIVVNSRRKCLEYILKFILKISTILCISWICQPFFYCIMKRKKFTITKYLSIHKLVIN